MSDPATGPPRTLVGFWGKTSVPGEQQNHGYKPVVHHLLDVAAVALDLLQSSSDRVAREAMVLGLPLSARDRLARLLAFLVGLHDLGKFSAAFQAKQAELWNALGLGPYTGPGDPGHWRLTAIMLCSTGLAAELKTLLPNTDGDIRGPLIAAIAGHHGRPTSKAEHAVRGDVAAGDDRIGAPGLGAALAALGELKRLIGPEPLPELDALETSKALSWPLAGLTTFADWIGSDPAFFRFEAPDMPLDEYWTLSRERARMAIAGKGLSRKLPTLTPTLAAIARDISAPRPMQVEAEAMPLPEGPTLVVIEDTTGSGKTEAALVLAARMMAAGKAEGLYFALPTMATANAMYTRLGDIHVRLYAPGSRPNLVLAHGQAGRNTAFLDSIGKDVAERVTSDDEVAVFCHAWIADSRRKAFFADVGAGTVDQAFLAVLRKKWLALRQYGLAGKVLLIDEAHAYDAYMFRELETLLRVHAAAGGSAIVLSATLAIAQRQQLVDSFRCGLGVRRSSPIGSGAYPLLTTAAADRVTEREVAFAETLRRSIAVERLSDAQSAHAAAIDAARQGAAVLLMRNAVDEAIASYEAIRAEHPQTRLFHARFAVTDRQRIEADVLKQFGRTAGQEQRAGQILVATQVVEQSLDLDFDRVITDLAPMDLLIQRAGRLWRHMDRRQPAERPVDGPLLQVISPEPRADVAADWLGSVLGRGARVYDHPGVMWRTAREVFAAGAIRTPDDFRPMIEAVYAKDGPVPPELRKGQEEADGRAYGATAQAKFNLIDVEEGYAAVGDPSPDEEIGTRLGEPTVTIRLARILRERLVPWAYEGGNNAPPTMRDWAMSEVRVRKTWLGDFQPPPFQARLIEVTKLHWPEWDRNIPVLVVGTNGTISNARADATIAYSSSVGLFRMAGHDRTV